MRRKFWLTAIIVAMILLHQDFWFWRSAHPLLFGFLPPALWYHMLYSLAASATLYAAVKWAWPATEDEDSDESRQEHGR